MNIVIIDDEQVILSGLSKMIPQIDPDWNIYDIFSDASEALNNCNWDLVQVVLVDISMPGMDGLSLVSALRENGFDTLVIFITAHANFQYAQQGAHLQMFDYLLKPVSRTELKNVLARAQQHYGKIKAGYENADYIRQNLHTLRKHFLSDILFEERFIPTKEKEQKQRDYQLAGARYVLALLKTQLARNEVKSVLGKALESQTWMLYGQELCYELLAISEGSGDVQSVEKALCKINGQWVVNGTALELEGLAGAFRQMLPDGQSVPQSEETWPERALAEKELSASVRLAMQYINQHYMERLSLKSIAEAVYLHPTYLSNIFKKQTGYAMVDYINMVRIEQSKKLLPDPRNRIYWIVEQVGFSNQRYFSSVFKALIGMTPMQYRQNILMNGVSLLPVKYR